MSEPNTQDQPVNEPEHNDQPVDQPNRKEQLKVAFAGTIDAWNRFSDAVRTQWEKIDPDLRRVGAHLRSQSVLMIFAVLVRALNQLSTIAIVTAAAWGIGQFALNPDSEVMSHTMVVLVVLGALKGLFRYLEDYTGYSATLNLVGTLRDQFYRRLEVLAPAGLIQARSGDIVTRATSDIDRIEAFFSQTVAPVVVAVLVPFLALLAMFWINGWLAVVLLPFLLGVGAVVTWWFDRLSKQDHLSQRGATADLNAHATDGIQGLREIIVFGNQKQRQQDIHERSERLTAVQGRMADVLGKQDGATDLIMSAGVLVVLLVGLALVGLEQIAVVELPAAVALAMMSFGPILNLTNVIQHYHEAMASARRLFEILDQPEIVRETATTPPPEPIEPSITFENVFFRYPASIVSSNGQQAAQDTTDWVHNDLNFTVPAGQKVALVGASGVGKTSVVHLLLRFWDANKGHIRVGGVNVREFPLEDLRRRIAVVSQNTYIFNTTIRENLLIGNPQATDGEIEQAARQADIHEFIISLPDRYKTHVGEMGTSLSGGQRQRLAIARALLKDAPILVLDEATSNLDAESERAIQTTIQELMQGRTTLVIAHRLSTVVNADHILVIDNGHIVEQGKHADLLASQGIYARLFSSQQDENVRLLQ